MRTILHIFSTFAVGGPQRRFATVAKALGAYRHLIVAMDNNHAAAELLGDVDHELLSVEIKKGKALDLGNLQRLRGLMKAHEPDLLCTYNWGAMEAVIANRIAVSKTLVPQLHFEDGFGPEETPTRQLPRRVQMRRLFLKSIPVIVPSQTLYDLAATVWGLKAVRLVPNGVDTEKFRPGERRGESKPLTIGTVGALRPEKNFGALIYAVADAGLGDEARLIIAGSGAEAAALQDRVSLRGMEGRVSFAGHVADPATLYGTFDIFAMSSLTEQMPLSLLEAMASGLPVVATDVGDCKEMVAEENRPFIVPGGDQDALAGALRKMCADADLRDALGAANRQRAEDVYGLEGMIAAYDQLWSGRPLS